MALKKYAGDVEAILARRHDNGGDYWATPDGRLLVGDPYSTLTSLLVLHELRVVRTHEAVRGALNAVLEAWREDGRFRIAPGATMYPCHTFCTRMLFVRRTSTSVVFRERSGIHAGRGRQYRLQAADAFNSPETIRLYYRTIVKRPSGISRAALAAGFAGNNRGLAPCG